MNPIEQSFLLLLGGAGGVEVIRWLLSRADKGADLGAQLRGELRADNLALRKLVSDLTAEVAGLRESNAQLKAEVTLLRLELQSYTNPPLTA